MLLCINLVTDILDGLIARTFKLETELGAKLDSYADVGSYIAAFTGMIMLENEFVVGHKYEFILLIGLWALPQLVSLIRFRRSTSFHLYSNKITGYIAGTFFFIYFVFGYYPVHFYFLLIFASLAYIEALVIVLSIPHLQSNLKSIYHFYKSKSSK
jgi:CDP-diacylglycerol--glycerol-3-phosphate 3-phosphatidyltransferase